MYNKFNLITVGGKAKQNNNNNNKRDRRTKTKQNTKTNKQTKKYNDVIQNQASHFVHILNHFIQYSSNESVCHFSLKVILSITKIVYITSIHSSIVGVSSLSQRRVVAFLEVTDSTLNKYLSGLHRLRLFRLPRYNNAKRNCIFF